MNTLEKTRATIPLRDLTREAIRKDLELAASTAIPKEVLDVLGNESAELGTWQVAVTIPRRNHTETRWSAEAIVHANTVDETGQEFFGRLTSDIAWDIWQRVTDEVPGPGMEYAIGRARISELVGPTRGERAAADREWMAELVTWAQVLREDGRTLAAVMTEAKQLTEQSQGPRPALPTWSRITGWGLGLTHSS